MSQILLINDFVSRGKIAGNMVDPVLSHAGHDVYFLPTALISHNFSLGDVAILDTNKYIKDCLNVWKKLDFNFDLIFIGYIENIEQKNIIVNYLKSMSDQVLVILDPIMGDDGSLYPGLGDEKIQIYKEILTYADIIIPNHTEASYLDLDNFDDLLDDDKKYVITSIEEDKKSYTLGISDKLYRVFYKKLDAKYAGTGDLFDGLFIKHYLETCDFNLSIEKTVEDMSKILRMQKEEFEDNISIAIETILPKIEGAYNA